jgi:hypothetical protein
MAKKNEIETLDKNKQFIIDSVKYMMANKSQTSLDTRREKFGMAADCDIIIEGRLAAIVIDNSLPDDDMAILVTNVEKIIDKFLGAAGSRFMQEAKGVKLFEEV